MSVHLVTSSEVMDLIDDLRNEGYNLSTRHYVAAHDILIVLYSAAENRDMTTLEALFGPIVCATPEEQNRFPSIFRRWVERVRRRVEQENPAAVQTDAQELRKIANDDSVEEDLNAVTEKAGSFRKKLIIAGVSAVTLAGVVWLLTTMGAL
jgi:hypothetical protein